jgi:DNA-binding response OmpR family regulator
VVTYSSLAKELWGEEYPGSVEAIRVYIQRLREKIEEDPALPKIIETKVGLGYILNLLD